MKRIFTYLLALIGAVSAYAQQTPNGGTYEMDEFKTPNGKTVKFHALMHSCIRIEYDGKEIQIDPVVQRKHPSGHEQALCRYVRIG